MGRTRPGFTQRTEDALTAADLTGAIGPAATFTGPWVDLRGFSRWDCILTAAATGTFTAQYSNDGAAVIAAYTDAWNVPVGTWTFPIVAKANYGRLVFLDTGGGGNVALAATLDPREIASEIPVYRVESAALAGGATVDIPLPPGTRHYRVGSSYGAMGAGTRLIHWYLIDAAAAQSGPAGTSNQQNNNTCGALGMRLPVPTGLTGGVQPTALRVTNIDVSPDVLWIDFLPA